MKSILISLLILTTYNVQAESVVLKKSKKKKPVAAKVQKTESAKTPDMPCDSKEDILKKLEEKKKAESSAGKGFSLQGGNTGCSVK